MKRSLPVHRLPPGAPGVSRACKGIVRYIHARGLGVGDHLPPQQALRLQLGFSNDTLSAAMQSLVASGLLSRRTGRGTKIVSLAPLASLNWVVGIAGLVAPDHGPSAFFGDLLHRLLAKLSRANCRCNTYFMRPDPQWPHQPNDFPGLQEDLDDGLLDGLFALTDMDPRTWTRLARRGIAVWHVGIWDNMPGATVIDRRGALADAVTLFRNSGIRRMALLDREAEKLVREIRATATTPLEAVPLDRDPDSARLAALAILRRPAGQRPTGLILLDDYATLGVTQALASQADYRPRIAAMTNQQLPLPFPLPVDRFELDIDEMAERAIASLRQRLLNIRGPGGVEYIRPRLAGSPSPETP